MNIKSAFNTSRRISLIAFTIVAFGFAGLPVQAAPEKKSDSSANSVSKKQKEFSSAKDAADALLHAAEAFDVAALKEILGPNAADLIASADPVADKKRATDFPRVSRSTGAGTSRARREGYRRGLSQRAGAPGAVGRGFPYRE